MKLYQFVWTVLFIYIGYKGKLTLLLLSIAFTSMHGYGTFFGGVLDYRYDDEESTKGKRFNHQWFKD